MYTDKTDDKFAIIDIAQTLERIRALLKSESGRNKVNKAIRINWMGGKR